MPAARPRFGDRASDAEDFGKIATPNKNKVPPSARLGLALMSLLETVLAEQEGIPTTDEVWLREDQFAVSS